MHGAGGGAPKGNRNALKHGGRSAEVTALRREVNEICRAARETIASLTEAAKDDRFHDPHDARSARRASSTPFSGKPGEGVLKGSGRMIVGSVSAEVYRRIEEHVRGAGAPDTSRPENAAATLTTKPASEQNTNIGAARAITAGPSHATPAAPAIDKPDSATARETLASRESNTPRRRQLD